MSSGISLERYGERLATVAERARGSAIAAVLCGPGPDLEWLIGYDQHPTERLTMLLVPADGEATLVVPRLEREIAGRAPALRSGVVAITTWEETEDPLDRVEAALGDASGELLVSDELWAIFLLRLEERFGGGRFGPASRLLRPLREVKDADEIRLLRDAAHAADRVIAALCAGRLIGRSERDVAREVRERLVDEGHDIALFWTVAGGPDTAAPHHSDSDRVIEAGEPLLFDIGGRVGGYCSDITRTVWVEGNAASGPDDGFRALYSVVQEAQAGARESAAPGVACESVDRAARQTIESAGYGDRFLHRTGHGIGLEVHEYPYIVAGNSQPLVAGNAFSVEPGIYLEGRYGARIEDIVICTADGSETLNQAPRELVVVRGE